MLSLFFKPVFFTFLIHLYYLLIVLIVARLYNRDVGFRRTQKLLVESFLIGVIIGGSFFVLAIIFGQPSKPTFVEIICVVFLSWIWIGFTEEALFRGLIQTYLMDKLKSDVKLYRLKLNKGTIVSSVIFGLAHFFNLLFGAKFTIVLFQSIFATFIGLILGYVYQETKSIEGPTKIHNVANGLAAIAPYVKYMLT